MQKPRDRERERGAIDGAKTLSRNGPAVAGCQLKRRELGDLLSFSSFCAILYARALARSSPKEKLLRAVPFNTRVSRSLHTPFVKFLFVTSLYNRGTFQLQAAYVNRRLTSTLVNLSEQFLFNSSSRVFFAIFSYCQDTKSLNKLLLLVLLCGV